MFLLFLLSISTNFLCGKALFNIYPLEDSVPPADGNYGDPLFLTPFIEKGQIVDGQAAATVKPIKGNLASYSGFLTVNKVYNSNMFFWFFPSEKNNSTAPVVVWLQGGPGASSLFGLFNEIGPFYVKLHRGLKMRQYYWSQVVNVIFIDNPVGTGFSFTENNAGYAVNEDAVAKDLYSAVYQFFQLFPQYQNNDFYIAGESYAGKYVPSLANEIDKNNPKASLKINLKGISIGNGLCDPITMMNYGVYLYQIGLLDINAKAEVDTRQAKIVSLIKQKKYIPAFEEFDKLLNGDLTPYKTLFYNKTGYTFYFNYLHDKEYFPFGSLEEYLKKDVLRRSIHVGNLTFHGGVEVEKFLRGDIMQSVKPLIAALLEKYRVLVYNGQLDIIVAYPLTVRFLQSLSWSGADKYKTAPRNLWFVDGQLAGYSKSANYLTEVLVRNAGHMVPADQPLWALDLIERFTSNKPF
ncbi:venom serine carboxypeptidase-like [Rhodnius prolixus]|uniref:Carboxypeptidase n=1 Tax=Rhodnius prolixus TaxID=13249 RepID=R4FLC5_RHOPR